jgi:ferredoxin
MRVWVDETKCRGHALCLRGAPEAFGFEDLEDHAFVRDGAVGSVPDAVFLKAASECPERAIVVESQTSEGELT